MYKTIFIIVFYWCRLMRVVCPSLEKEKEFAVHVFSEEWFGGSAWSRTPPSFLVEFVGREAGNAYLNWLEISKSKSFSAKQVDNGTSWECKHRYFNCIDGKLQSFINYFLY